MTYRISALGAALRRMWRTTGLALPVILGNAVLQGLLLAPTWPDLAPWLGALATAGSAVIVLVGSLVLLACGLGAAQETGQRATAQALLRQHAGRAALATAAVWLLALAVSLLYTVPGLLLAAVLIFVPTAAMAGAGVGFGQGLRTIRNGPGRWLATLLAVGLLGGISWLTATLLAFFMQATLPLAAFLTWLFIGLIAWWVATGLALIYQAKGGDVELTQGEAVPA